MVEPLAGSAGVDSPFARFFRWVLNSNEQGHFLKHLKKDYEKKGIITVQGFRTFTVWCVCSAVCKIHTLMFHSCGFVYYDWTSVWASVTVYVYVCVCLSLANDRSNI